jgi:hypothetical protein
VASPARPMRRLPVLQGPSVRRPKMIRCHAAGCRHTSPDSLDCAAYVISSVFWFVIGRGIDALDGLTRHSLRVRSVQLSRLGWPRLPAARFAVPAPSDHSTAKPIPGEGSAFVPSLHATQRYRGSTVIRTYLERTSAKAEEAHCKIRMRLVRYCSKRGDYASGLPRSLALAAPARHRHSRTEDLRPGSFVNEAANG